MNIPEVTFRTREGDVNFFRKCGFGGEWKDKTTDDYFKDKKVVLFALPGAFTPTCYQHHLPEYEEKYDEMKSFGIDEIYVLSVNDTFVMNSWMEAMKAKNVKAIADGEGKFTKGMGMLVNKPKQGFGMRSWRYSALIDNGEVKKMFIEEGKNDESNDDDPFKVSDANTMLNYLKEAK